MGDEHRQKSSSHRLTEFYVFLNVMLVASAGRQSCGMQKGGSMYIGTLNQTKSGRACQPWGADYPNKINSDIMDEFFPDGSMDAAENFCRNPMAGTHRNVYCYINEAAVGTEECDPCRGGYEGYHGCVLADRGANYAGTIDRTQSNTFCQEWSDYPGSEKLKFAVGDARQNRNYCRNPDPQNYEAPWCYIADVPDQPWEYCDICRPFQGEIVSGAGFYNWAVEKIPDMTKIACIRWCINYGSCMGVSTSNGEWAECKYFIRTDGAAEENELWEHFFVKRVCDPMDKELTAHFVEITQVFTSIIYQGNQEILGRDLESCDSGCASRPNCAYYQTDDHDRCYIFDKISSHEMISLDIGTYIRMPMRCDPAQVAVEYLEAAPEFHEDSLQDQAVTVPDEAEETPAGNAKEKEEEKDVFAITEESPHAKKNKAVTIPEKDEEKAGLSIPMIAGIAGGVIIVVVGGGFACYKVYKKTKEQDKARAKAEGKLKGTPTAQGEKTKLNP